MALGVTACRFGILLHLYIHIYLLLITLHYYIYNFILGHIAMRH